MNTYKFHRPTSLTNLRVRAAVTKRCLPKRLVGCGLDIGADDSFVKAIGCELENTPHGLDFDLDELPYDDGRFDFLFHHQTIEHLLNPLYHLRECHRILKSRGLLFLTTPVAVLPPILWLGDHFHEFDRRRLIDLLSVAGFEVVKCKRLRYYWRWGLFRPILRLIFGRDYFVIAQKC